MSVKRVDIFSRLGARVEGVMPDADTLEQVVFQALLRYGERGKGGDPRHGESG